jgi:hypothetical protein
MDPLRAVLQRLSGSSGFPTLSTTISDVKRYSRAIKLDTKQLMEAIDQGLKEVAERSTTLNLSTAGSPTLNAVRVWTGGGADTAEADSAASADPLMQDAAALDALENQGGSATDARHVISAGIRDVTEALTSDFALNDVLHMVLETMHRGFGFCRTLAFKHCGASAASERVPSHSCHNRALRRHP